MKLAVITLVVAFLVVLAVADDDKFASRGLPAAKWLTYEEGLAAAKENGKPVMVLFTQPWCGACKNLKSELSTYSKAFKEAAENLNLVSIEGEAIPDESKLFTKDGGYIPRAYFLSPDGTPDYSIAGPNDKYKYYFSSPVLLVQAMVKGAELRNVKKDL